MSIPNFRLCDVCGAHLLEATSLYVATGTQPCAAGGPSEEVGEQLDLCDLHKAEALRVLLGPDSEVYLNDYVAGKRLLAWAKAQRKPAGRATP